MSGKIDKFEKLLRKLVKIGKLSWLVLIVSGFFCEGSKFGVS